MKYFTKIANHCVTHLGTIYHNCHNYNVIYLITCDKHQFQYVRETVQQLNKIWYKSGFWNPSKSGHFKTLLGHFQKVYVKAQTRGFK